MRQMWFFVTFFAFFFIVVNAIHVVKTYQLQHEIIGHLYLAANANTIELAKSELGIAIQSIERRGLTSGNTSLIFFSPQNDIGFWYRNLKASYQELERVSPHATQLETTNTLMKLRETLVDQEGSKTIVAYPQNLALYPYISVHYIVLFFTIAALVSSIFAAIRY